MTAEVLPATVRTWGDRREVVLDDGRVLTVAGQVPLEGFRTLRTGQRVRLRLEDGAVTGVTWPID